MAQFFKDLKLPNLETLKVLMLDEDHKLVASDLDINNITGYFITESISKEDLQTIVNYLFEMGIVVTKNTINVYILDNRVSAFVPVEIDTSTSDKIILRSSHHKYTYEGNDENSNVTVYDNTYGIEIDIEGGDTVSSYSFKNIRNTVSSIPVLATDLSANGEDVDYKPTNDAQPTNKKYVDEQDEKLNDRIVKLEEFLPEIEEALIEINGETPIEE